MSIWYPFSSMSFTRQCHSNFAYPYTQGESENAAIQFVPIITARQQHLYLDSSFLFVCSCLVIKFHWPRNVIRLLQWAVSSSLSFSLICKLCITGIYFVENSAGYSLNPEPTQLNTNLSYYHHDKSEWIYSYPKTMQ